MTSGLQEKLAAAHLVYCVAVRGLQLEITPPPPREGPREHHTAAQPPPQRAPCAARRSGHKRPAPTVRGTMARCEGCPVSCVATSSTCSTLPRGSATNIVE
mmetsp:Transcript_74872/g.199147  ORF Transcript_74872/g.199147 Transcript_74872/m.199147 type:complete len:101 (-) Transcript_74872:261-563(-)